MRSAAISTLAQRLAQRRLPPLVRALLLQHLWWLWCLGSLCMSNTLIITICIQALLLLLRPHPRSRPTLNPRRSAPWLREPLRTPGACPRCLRLSTTPPCWPTSSAGLLSWRGQRLMWTGRRRCVNCCGSCAAGARRPARKRAASKACWMPPIHHPSPSPARTGSHRRRASRRLATAACWAGQTRVATQRGGGASTGSGASNGQGSTMQGGRAYQFKGGSLGRPASSICCWCACLPASAVHTAYPALLLSCPAHHPRCCSTCVPAASSTRRSRRAWRLWATRPLQSAAPPLRCATCGMPLKTSTKQRWSSRRLLSWRACGMGRSSPWRRKWDATGWMHRCGLRALRLL